VRRAQGRPLLFGVDGFPFHQIRTTPLRQRHSRDTEGILRRLIRRKQGRRKVHKGRKVFRKTVFVPYVFFVADMRKATRQIPRMSAQDAWPKGRGVLQPEGATRSFLPFLHPVRLPKSRRCPHDLEKPSFYSGCRYRAGDWADPDLKSSGKQEQKNRRGHYGRIRPRL
jgi:hypothetical protein